MRRTFADSARTNWAGTAPRPIVASVWYPAAPDAKTTQILPEAVPFSVPMVAAGAPVVGNSVRYPLVVLSHGTGGAGLQLMWLGHYLAARGNIVVALSHHGNSGDGGNYEPQGFMLWWERARDVTIAIDRMIADSVFGSRIDPARIAAAGFSLGGYTVIALVGGRTSLGEFARFCSGPNRDFTCGPQLEFPEAPARFDSLRKSDAIVQASLARAGNSYLDPRIKAVFAIAPALGSAFTSQSLGAIRIPVAIAAGAGDSVAPVATNAQRLATLISNAKLTVLPGAVGHYVFLAECKPAGVREIPICRDAPGVDRAAIHSDVAGMVDTFFRSVLRP
jgi:predicted dienelactone hydrolase